jgi:hypothetical protein
VKYSYSLARLIIGRIDENTNEVHTFTGHTIDNEREIIVEGDFEEGNYALYVEMDWNTDFVRDIVLSCYGEVAVVF